MVAHVSIVQDSRDDFFSEMFMAFSFMEAMSGEYSIWADC
jgi:hypothetical protein